MKFRLWLAKLLIGNNLTKEVESFRNKLLDKELTSYPGDNVDDETMKRYIRLAQLLSSMSNQAEIMRRMFLNYLSTGKVDIVE